MLRFFNHYIALPTLMLAAVEACLFFALLFMLTMFGLKSAGIESAVSTLSTLDLVVICSAFLLLLAAIGLYNRDAIFELGVLLQRSIIFLFIVVFLGFIAWIVDNLIPGVILSAYISLLALATAINFLVILSIRVALISFPKINLFKRRIIVLGRGHLGHRIEHFLNGEGGNTLKEVGFVDLEDLNDEDSQTSTKDRFKDLKRLAREKKADEIVIASREWRGLPIWELLECKMSGVAITDYLTFWERETGQIDLEEVKPSWLALSDGFRVSPLRKLLKRLFDITVSAAFLILTFPLLVVTALFVKLESPGPVFYRQERVGINGKVFKVIKFRSMRENAEEEGIPQWASADDKRVTRVGRFIRRSRIDEIPQIINVLLGQMSFVGPRPERPYFIDQLKKQIPLYGIRHNVRPGITGWAQVNYSYGASVEDAKRKLSYDLYYVKNGSLFLDIVVILQTVRVVLSGHGAR